MSHTSLKHFTVMLEAQLCSHKLMFEVFFPVSSLKLHPLQFVNAIYFVERKATLQCVNLLLEPP